MKWLEPVRQWAESNETALWWMFAGSLALLVLSPIVAGWIIIRLPDDYFSSDEGHTRMRWVRHPLVRPILIALKNIVGVNLLLAGIAMLFVPGQGLLTIAIGVMLTDFPGKPRLLRWLVARPAVWRSMNWLRKRAARPPLKQPT